jgi:hypothetical protein
MTINIEVYTKKQPDVNDLAKPLNLEKERVMEGYDFYKWFPHHCGNSVWVILERGKPNVYAGEYDRETLEDMAEVARSNGFLVPRELTDKFIADDYWVKADKTLAGIISTYPHIKQAFPHLLVEFSLAEFSKGNSLFNVGLEAKQFASQNTLKAMVELAAYFAHAFDGLVYEDQTNKIGIPNFEELHRIGMTSFLTIVKNAKESGMSIKPAEDF